MKKRSIAVPITVHCALCLLIALQAQAASPLPAEQHRYLRQGIEKAFNLEVLSAESFFRKAVDLDPDDPTGYAFLAVNQQFRAELSFDSKERKARQEAMLRFVDETLARGEKRVETNSRDSQAHFAMALARTVRFRWALNQKKYFMAADDAYCLWGSLETVQRVDPENYDSYMLTGLIRYHIDHLPDVSRFFSSFLIAQGDSRRGLADLERAAARGDLLREIAQSELIAVYLNFEKQPARVLPLARDLQKKFPRNYNFSFALANVLSEINQFREALAIAREIEKGIASGVPPFAPQLQPRYDQLMGRIFFAQGDYSKATDFFQKSLKDTSDYNARVRVWSYVRLGMISDVQNDREQAKEYYSMALGIDSGESVAKVEARKYLKTPYKSPSKS